ncbi:MAG: helix-turn-helix domain-containing protein [Patescibacteria group bacterium]|nr:helix-turn-helix domain-containing protein [Patescibacteria group bacterium]
MWIPEAAEILHLSESTVRAYCNRGQIPAKLLKNPISQRHEYWIEAADLMQYEISRHPAPRTRKDIIQELEEK